MSSENVKRLYEHYKKINYVAALQDLLKKYPALQTDSSVPAEKSKKVTEEKKTIKS